MRKPQYEVITATGENFHTTSYRKATEQGNTITKIHITSDDEPKFKNEIKI